MQSNKNDPQNLQDQIPTNDSPQAPQKVKDPFIAILISFFIPGGGQLYVGHLERGILMFALTLLCGIGWLIGIIDAYLLADKANKGLVEYSDKYIWYPFIFLGVGLIVFPVAIFLGLILLSIFFPEDMSAVLPFIYAMF